MQPAGTVPYGGRGPHKGGLNKLLPLEVLQKCLGDGGTPLVRPVMAVEGCTGLPGHLDSRGTLWQAHRARFSMLKTRRNVMGEIFWHNEDRFQHGFPPS
jgi:hypothetical protein